MPPTRRIQPRPAPPRHPNATRFSRRISEAHRLAEEQEASENVTQSQNGEYSDPSLNLRFTGPLAGPRNVVVGQERETSSTNYNMFDRFTSRMGMASFMPTGVVHPFRPARVHPYAPRSLEDQDDSVRPPDAAMIGAMPWVPLPPPPPFPFRSFNVHRGVAVPEFVPVSLRPNQDGMRQNPNQLLNYPFPIGPPPPPPRQRNEAMPVPVQVGYVPFPMAPQAQSGQAGPTQWNPQQVAEVAASKVCKYSQFLSEEVTTPREILNSFGPEGLKNDDQEDITDIEEMVFQNVLRKKLICDICMTHMKRFRCSECFYAMCRECVSNLSNEFVHQAVIPCPQCRKGHKHFVPVILPRF